MHAAHSVWAAVNTGAVRGRLLGQPLGNTLSGGRGLPERGRPRPQQALATPGLPQWVAIDNGETRRPYGDAPEAGNASLGASGSALMGLGR